MNQRASGRRPKPMRAIGLLAPVLLVLGALGVAGSGAVFAYDGCDGHQSGSVELTVVTGGETDHAVATFNDCDGTPDAGAQVTFSTISGPNRTAIGQSSGGIQLAAYTRLAAATAANTTCQAVFTPPSGVTDQTGAVAFAFVLPPNCPGAYVLAASVPDPDAGTVVTVRFAVREVGGFPNTTVAPAPAQAPVTLALLLIAGGLTLCGAAGVAWQLGNR